MRRQLLIVEDDLATRSAMADYFELLDCEVRLAADLPEAIRQLREAAFDCIITDVRLGGSGNQDGLEVARLARRGARAPRVIVLTAHPTPEIERTLAAASHLPLLVKPVPMSRLADIALRDPPPAPRIPRT